MRKSSFLKNNLSDLETFILLTLFAVLVLIYSIFGVFESEINSLIKLLPFLALSIYAYIKGKWSVRESKRNS